MQPHLNVIALVHVPQITLINFQGPSYYADESMSCPTVVCQWFSSFLLLSSWIFYVWRHDPCTWTFLRPSGSMWASRDTIIWSWTCLFGLTLIFLFLDLYPDFSVQYSRFFLVFSLDYSPLSVAFWPMSQYIPMYSIPFPFAMVCMVCPPKMHILKS